MIKQKIIPLISKKDYEKLIKKTNQDPTITNWIELCFPKGLIFGLKKKGNK